MRIALFKMLKTFSWAEDTIVRISRSDAGLSVRDGVALVGGVVIGAGIFKTPALVAASFNSQTAVIGAWALGGLISLTGALCYAELSSAFPSKGGEYNFLLKSYGAIAAFLFAWARILVIQTGSIAMLAFLVGDYASAIITLGPYSASVYAGVVVAALTMVNIAGLRIGSGLQRVMFGALLAGLGALAITGFLVSPVRESAIQSGSPVEPALGRAMIFVLLTYGGWNEGAYISSEIRGGSRNVTRMLMASIGLITVLYCIVNIAFLRGLGLGAIAGSDVVAADLMSKALGGAGAAFISALVVLASISTANASIITGARTSYALGKTFSLLRFVYHWRPEKSAPVRALLLQAAIALVLIAVGAVSRNGFAVMVEYTAPVFWFFFLLTGVSLFVLRFRKPDVQRPFTVPLYPVTPAVFCAACLYMVHASLVHTGRGALIGVAVLVSGLPFLFLQRNQKQESV